MKNFPSCSECHHAIRIPGSALLCGASSAYYECDGERAMSFLKALCYHACGREGRFFIPVRAGPVPAAAGPARAATAAATMLPDADLALADARHPRITS